MKTNTIDQIQGASAVNVAELLALLREFHAAAEMHERPSMEVMTRAAAVLDPAVIELKAASPAPVAGPSDELKLLKVLDDAVARRVRRFDGSCTLELDFRCEGKAKLVESQLKSLAART